MHANCLWISRVPETLESACEIIAAVAPDLMEDLDTMSASMSGSPLW